MYSTRTVFKYNKLADSTRGALGCSSARGEICAVPQDRVQRGVAFASDAAKEVLWDKFGGY